MLQGPLSNSLVWHIDAFPPKSPVSLYSPSCATINVIDLPRQGAATAYAVEMVNSQPLPQQGTRGSSHFSGGRPSSRRALTAALELAQEAVRLDTTNDDPIGAIRAYSRSVALLNEVMERVMRGEDSNDASKGGRHGGRPRSAIAKEEEVRRLKSIHDTYADRMNILSDIYNVDPNNPTVPRTQPQLDLEQSHLNLDDFAEDTGNELIGSAMLVPSRESTSTPDSSKTGSDNTYMTDNSLPEFEMVHPPSVQQSTGTTPTVSTGVTNTSASNPRISALPPPRPPPSGPLPTRPRTGSLSNLPPQAPPPRTAPPLPPANYSEFPKSALLVAPVATRPRGNSTGHKQTGSDKLEALHEESDVTSVLESHPRDPLISSVDQAQHTRVLTLEGLPTESHPISPTPPLKDIHPLPSIPPSPMLPFSVSSSPSTPRGSSFITQPHPFSVQEAPAHLSKARTISTSVLRSDTYGQTSLASINLNTTNGIISQRRSKSSTGTQSSLTSSRSSPTEVVQPTLPLASQAPAPPVPRLTASSLPASTANSLGIGRNRSSSQPPRPLVVTNTISEFGVRTSSPPGQITDSQTAISRKASFPSRLNPSAQSNPSTQASVMSSFYPSSPFPSPPPADPLRKPYHLMSLVWHTMTSKTGGYITRRLHVPHEVWSQGGAKLLNLPEKVRVLEVLSGGLEEIQMASNDLTSNMPIHSAAGVGRNEVERWLIKLDEWNGVCEGIVASIGKKLGVGEGFGSKKGGVTSWSGKFVRSFDRMTNGKNLDSPAIYVAGLTKVFKQAQLLDDHTKALLGSPTASLYASVPVDVRQNLEVKFKRSSEFFASVVLTFVVRDLSQLLDKYVKKGEKWLAE